MNSGQIIIHSVLYVMKEYCAMDHIPNERTMHHVYVYVYVYSLSIPTSLSIASWNLRGREIVVAFEANQAFCA